MIDERSNYPIYLQPHYDGEMTDPSGKVVYNGGKFIDAERFENNKLKLQNRALWYGFGVVGDKSPQNRLVVIDPKSYQQQYKNNFPWYSVYVDKYDGKVTINSSLRSGGFSKELLETFAVIFPLRSAFSLWFDNQKYLHSSLGPLSGASEPLQTTVYSVRLPKITVPVLKELQNPSVHYYKKDAGRLPAQREQYLLNAIREIDTKLQIPVEARLSDLDALIEITDKLVSPKDYLTLRQRALPILSRQKHNRTLHRSEQEILQHYQEQTQLYQTIAKSVSPFVGNKKMDFSNLRVLNRTHESLESRIKTLKRDNIPSLRVWLARVRQELADIATAASRSNQPPNSRSRIAREHIDKLTLGQGTNL